MASASGPRYSSRIDFAADLEALAAPRRRAARELLFYLPRITRDVAEHIILPMIICNEYPVAVDSGWLLGNTHISISDNAITATSPDKQSRLRIYTDCVHALAYLGGGLFACVSGVNYVYDIICLNNGHLQWKILPQKFGGWRYMRRHPCGIVQFYSDVGPIHGECILFDPYGKVSYIRQHYSHLTFCGDPGTCEICSTPREPTLGP